VTVPAISHHTGIQLAEAGFLLILIAGVWLDPGAEVDFGA
jgi:hypothetical protein